MSLLSTCNGFKDQRQPSKLYRASFSGYFVYILWSFRKSALQIEASTCERADFLLKLTLWALIWSFQNRFQNICKTILCGRSCYVIFTRLLMEVCDGVCIFRIADMLLFKCALKHRFLHFFFKNIYFPNNETNKKTKSISRVTSNSLYFEFSLCRFKTKIVTDFLLVTTSGKDGLRKISM